MHKENRKGFTLIELSISLVIIGLIVGGILGARELIEQAKVRAFITEIGEYKSAFFTFKLKYNALPGDMTNASSYWPSCDTPATDCDGDGDGQIELGGEDLRAWQQLTDSGIIPGSYTGEAGTTTHEIGVNMPETPFETAGYLLIYLVGPPYNGLQIGSVETASGTIRDAFLTGPDAYGIDTKMDDGLAQNGEVRARQPGADGTCFTGGGTTEYDLDGTTVGCYFRIAFFH